MPGLSKFGITECRYDYSLSLLQWMETIAKLHHPAQPLFLYMAFQNVHDPVQAPQQYILDK